MASLLRKDHMKNNLERACIQRDDVQDLVLLDESDAFPETNLTLEIDDKDEDAKSLASPTASVSFEGDFPGTGMVSFDVVSADKIKDGRSSFVKYTILISSHNKIQKVPGTVEKRYSDFEKLNSCLRKRFPGLMEEVSFPGKLLMGNFKNETIARRSRAFEQYLTHLFSIHKVRFSPEFISFFYEDDLRNGYSAMESGCYADAITILEKCLPVQEKLQGDWHPDVIGTLCSLVICYHAIDKIDMALKYADSALLCLQGNRRDKHYLPLLHLDIYFHWMQGKDKAHLEASLAQLRKDGVNTEKDINLKALVLDRFKS
ncbi:sorting nexin-20-like [Argopecten irradians]|uniref:sorting nexin-20-like n=1 Tax=Argopecten irradians TaxID=31199 RepID=UPI00371F7A58